MKRAFTLIEVLLAVAVFAIVLAAINSVFFAALRLRNKATASFERALPLQQTLGLLKRDLEGIMLPSGRFGGSFTTSPEATEATPVFVGERVTPDIYTSSGAVNGIATWSDIQKIAYYLTAPTNNVSQDGGKDLIRLVTRNLLPINIEEAERQWLMGGVQDFRLQYYDGVTWTETWVNSTTTNLPSAIKIQIVLREDALESAGTPLPIELVVPILVQVATNSTEEATGGAQ